MEHNFSAEKLIALRKLKGYSQEKLAEEAGLTIRTIQRLEKNEVSPQPHTMSCLANALQIPIEELCVLDSKTENTEEVNKQLSFLHFSALTGCLLPLGNIIAPYIVSFYKKEKNTAWNIHLKTILNFQLSWLLYVLLILLVFFTIESMAFVIFIVPILVFISLLFCPIVSGINVMKGNQSFYPLSLKII